MLDLNTDRVSKLIGGLAENLRGRSNRNQVDRKRQYSKFGDQATQFGPPLQIGAHDDLLDLGATNTFDRA